jgi:hypothetical protein
MIEWVIGIVVGLVLAAVVWKNWPEKAKSAYDYADALEDKVQEKYEELKAEVVKKEEPEAVPTEAPAQATASAPKPKRKRAAAKKKRAKK